MTRTHGRVVFTVGHSNHGMTRLEELLRTHGVKSLADVRSSPYSRFKPEFNREAVAAWLRDAGIAYEFLGRELGGRSDDPADYEKGRIRYGRLAAKPAFERGIERLVRRPANERVCLLCAEKEPLDCHRALLVAPALEARGVRVRHILADGRWESHQEAMNRLVELTGLKQRSLFGSGDPIPEAIRLRARQVGHAQPDRPNQHESRQP